MILSVLVLDVRCCDDCDDSEMRAMSDESTSDLPCNFFFSLLYFQVW